MTDEIEIQELLRSGGAHVLSNPRLPAAWLSWQRPLHHRPVRSMSCEAVGGSSTPMRLTAAKMTSRSGAVTGDGKAATGLGDQAPAASALAGLFGVDVGSLTIARLMQVMVECAAEMVACQHQALAHLRIHVAPDAGA